MAYTHQNFKTKKALKEAVQRGDVVRVYSPGMFPPRPGHITLEGPHYPAAHTWYAQAQVDETLAIIPGTIK